MLGCAHHTRRPRSKHAISPGLSADHGWSSSGMVATSARALSIPSHSAKKAYKRVF